MTPAPMISIMWAFLALLQPVDVDKAGVGKSPPGVGTPDQATDSTQVSDMASPPRIDPIIPQVGTITSDSLAWWPPGLNDVLPNLGLHVARQGRVGQRSIAGEPGGARGIGLLWLGLPTQWLAELGGDISVFSPAAASHIVASTFPPLMGSGSLGIGVQPWLDTIESPRTRLQVLGGTDNDRTYAFSMETGITSSVYSLFSGGFKSGDGNRTNSDYSFKQYDWRLDLDPPLMGSCRLLSHFSSMERGTPGVDPRLWEGQETPSFLDPGFWASDLGYGASDVMWADDWEVLTTRLVAIQTTLLARGRLPTQAAFFSEGTKIGRIRSIPGIHGDSLRTEVTGDLEANRKGFLSRVNLAEAETESLWVSFVVERMIRNAGFVLAVPDSIWNDSVEEEEVVGRLAVGIALSGTRAFFGGLQDDTGTHFNWGVEIDRKISEFDLSAGATENWARRGLEDLWLWKAEDSVEPQVSKGKTGRGWLSVAKGFSNGRVSLGWKAGWEKDSWDWCESDTLPPGRYALWRPSSLSGYGVNAAGEFSPVGGLDFDAEILWARWRDGDQPVPGRPDLFLRSRASFVLPIGDSAIPKGGINLRYVGEQYAGINGTLPLEAYWVADGWVEVEIGEFTILLLAENITGARYQEVRGYPIDGMSLELGFHWLFWD